ncbi:MAG: GAF domain-containing protein [Anaerolineae bacterium]
MDGKPQEESELSSLEEQLAKSREQLLIYAADLAKSFAAGRKKTKELEEKYKRLIALYEVSSTLTSMLDLEEVLNLAMGGVMEMMGTERGFAMLLDPKSDEWVLTLGRQIDRKEIDSPPFRASREVIEEVIATQTPIVVTNVQADQDLTAQTNGVGDGPRSILCLPLVIRKQLTGVIYVDNWIEKGTFTAQELDFLVAFADQAALAIENARLYENMTARMREAMALYKVSTRLMGTLNLDQLLEDILGELQRAFGYLNCALLLVDEDAEELCIKAARGYPSEIMAAGRIKIGHESIVGWVAANKAVLNVPDVTRDPRYIQWVKETRSEMAVPMLVGDKVIGVLDAQSPEVNAFNEDDLRVLSSMAAQAAMAIERARLYETTQQKKKRLEAEREWEEHEKQRIRELFQRYVAPTVVKRLIEGMEQVALGGKRQVVTILFADIRGFTSFSETRMPEELIEILNRHLSLAAQAVLEQEGTLDKFMGDAVMALFNAPLPQPDHTLRAVRAALTMKEATAAYHRKLDSEARLSFGVGINVGEAVVGNVGTAELMNYTAIGDSVNLAKGLQENAEAGQILLSQSAYDAVRKRVRVRALEPIKVKGRSSTVSVYELVGLKERPVGG